MRFLLRDIKNNKVRKFYADFFSFNKAEIFSIAGLWSKFITQSKGKRASKMRRLLFFTSLTLALGLFLQTSTFAQIDSKEIQEEMEKATKELQEQLKNFNFEDFQMDTLLLKNFNFPESFDIENFVMPNDIDMNEMLKMMELQMQQVDMEGMLKMMQENFSKMDFSEMEKMMEPFMNGEMFIIPSPENFEKNEGEEKQEGLPKKKTKKKKTYKM